MRKSQAPTEFDKRYRAHRERQHAARVADELNALAGRQIQALRSAAGRPASLRHFEDALGSEQGLNEIARSGARFIGTYCNFPADEIIHAAGAVPVRLCSALPSAASFAEEALPRDLCPVVKSSFGTFVGNIGSAARCDVVAVPASCDGKRKLASMLNDYADAWIVDLPARRDYASDMPRWVEETKLLCARVEKLTGRKIEHDRLAASIRLYHRRAEAFRELLKLRQKYPHILSGRDMMLVTNSSFVDGVEQWTEAVKALTRELTALAGKQPSAPASFRPLVLTGSPILWPNWKTLNIIEEAGGTVVADTLCSGTQRLHDPVQVDEWTYDGMIRALALRYFSASLCPCFIDAADYIDRVLELVQDYRACGVVSHNLRFCQLIDMDVVRLRSVLRERDIPLLSIQTDLSTEDREQIKTRVEAFLEMLA